MKTTTRYGQRMKNMSIIAASLLALGITSSFAMAADPHSGHSMTPADADTAPASDTPMKEAQAAPGSGMSMGAMDHGEMNMQGGSAPADARDPHAYSGGYKLGEGKYALAGPRQLRLADEHAFGTLLVDRFERVYGRDDSWTAFDTQAWFGRDYDRLVLKLEGDYAGGRIEEASTEVLWGHAIASYWDTQLGVRYDKNEGTDRKWLAFGVQGLAPRWFEVDATAYVGSEGRTALSLETEYEFLITQRLVLQPRAEISAYGKKDEANGIGSGLNEATVGLRLRYEFTRQFAPYIGVEWSNKFGQTADLARDEGERVRETRWVAGVRFWF